MLCEHLSILEKELIDEKIPELFRGKAWSNNCREWVYFDCYLKLSSIRLRVQLSDCVESHAHLGTFDGQENGFVCMTCHDAIMGHHEKYSYNKKIIK
jgi:hypothetical protein